MSTVPKRKVFRNEGKEREREREREKERKISRESEQERGESIPSGENSISLQDRPGAAIGQFSP